MEVNAMRGTLFRKKSFKLLIRKMGAVNLKALEIVLGIGSLVGVTGIMKPIAETMLNLVGKVIRNCLA
jgi:hypothetical protein